MASKYQLHVNRWKDCKECSLCNTRDKVVLARGSIPADVVFIGEAPGASENVLGRPFVGPAGQLLDRIIRKAGLTSGYALTNLVGCIPFEEDGEKMAEPEKESIEACQPRLVEFVRLCKPRLIVLVGKLAKKWVSGQSLFDPVDWLKSNEYVRFLEIVHPAGILRANVAQQSLMEQRCVVQLSSALEDL